MKPFFFLEILAFLTTFKIFHFGLVAQYNETILRNSHIPHLLQNFHLNRSPITTRPLWKISAFFTTLKNLRVFHLGRSPITTRPLWKIFAFFITLKNLCIFHLDRSPITTRSIWKIYAFFTTLKNLCIFHLFEKSLRFSPA